MNTKRPKKILVKIGTHVLTNADGFLDIPQIEHLAEQFVTLKKEGWDVIVVSSGAMGAGKSVIGESKGLDDVSARQALASVGQIQLIAAYADALKEHGYVCAQVLVAREDFRDRQHYLNIRNCLNELLSLNIIPVCNENDVVSVSELMFTDNDELAGLMGTMADVDNVVILTSVKGVYRKDGEEDIIREIAPGDTSWKQYILPSKSTFGRGGMHTKCNIAQKMSGLGITTHILDGREKQSIIRAVNGEQIGTVFHPERKQSNVKKWIAHTNGQEKGSVYINVGARDALCSTEKANSLLPIGITKIEGEFEKGDIVRILSEEGRQIGLGLAEYSAKTARANMGEKEKKYLVHYDYLYLDADLYE